MRVDTHDFPDRELGRAVPYGIYDVTANTGAPGRPNSPNARLCGQEAAGCWTWPVTVTATIQAYGWKPARTMRLLDP